MTVTEGFPQPEQANPPGVVTIADPDEVPNHRANADNPWFEADKPVEPPEEKRPGLGENRKRGSGVSQLTKADLKQLHGYYDSAAMLAMMVRPSAAEAITECADTCVTRWEELAKQNDNVRRMLLRVLEGGAWSALITAHMPIILACIPERVMENMPMLFGVLAKNDDDENGDNE